MTPEEFLSACRQKNDKGYDAIKEFIDNKGKFKMIKGPSDTSPLHLAARAGNIKIVQLLIDNDMNPLVRDKTKLGKTPIVDAIEKGLTDVALVMLASKKLKPLKTKKRYNEYTALGKSSVSDNDYKKLLDALLKVGLDAEELDDQGLTLMTRAIQNNEMNRLKICVKSGLNINNTERLPLKYALYREPTNNDIVKYLLENKAVIEIKTADEWSGFNALHTAHYRDNVEIFGLLIEKYNALETLDDETLEDIISHKEIPFLRYLWEIPKVEKFIIDNGLEDAFPQTVRDVFIF